MTEKSSDWLESALSKMSQKELKVIQTKISLLLASNQEIRNDEWEGFVFGQIQRLFREEGIKYFPYSILRRQTYYLAFKKGVQIFIDYIDKFCKPKNKAKKIKGVFVLLKMIIRRLKRDKIPVGYMTISQALQRVHSIVEEQFPGYRESGFLHFIIDKHKVE